MQTEQEFLDNTLTTVNEVSSMLHLAHREAYRRGDDTLDNVLEIAVGKLESVAMRINERRNNI